MGGDGIIVLGSPVGSIAFEENILAARIEKNNTILDKLHNIEDPQIEYGLLRSCFSMPKLSFALRATNFKHHPLLLEKFDDGIRRAMEEVVGAPLDDAAYIQASLPINMGGMGLRRAVDHCSAAYVSSYCASSSIICDIRKTSKVLSDHLDTSIDNINQLANLNLTYEEIAPMDQKTISFHIDTHVHKKLLGMAHNSRNLARLRAVNVKHAGAFLIATPCPNKGLKMSPQEFIFSTRYRLGLYIFPKTGICPVPNCRKESDRYGDHSLLCASSGERISRHNRLCDAIFGIAVEAGLSPRKEESDIFSGSK